MRAEKLCIALDFPTRAEVIDAARRFGERVGWLKIGLQAFLAEGPSLVAEVAACGPRVFLDVKLHDIPSTVERAIAAGAASGAAMINVHAFGGRAMLEAARRGASSSSVKVIAVTLLTSLDARSLADLPVAGHPEGIARRLAVLARDSGLDGVVCAAADLPGIRSACGPGFLTVVPGIRSAGAEASDQKRAASAADALKAGADLIVVGRPITGAPDPDEALNGLLREIESAG